MKWKVDCLSVEELWVRISVQLPRNNRELCAIILRNIWLQRNAFIFKEKFTNPKVLFSSASHQHEAFISAMQHLETNRTCRPRNGASRWLAPQNPQLKYNWDITSLVSYSSLGGLIWDSKGEVILSFCSNHFPILDPTEAQVMTLRKAMQLCWKLNMSNIIYEGDYLQVVTIATNLLLRNDVIGPILLYIHKMVESA